MEAASQPIQDDPEKKNEGEKVKITRKMVGRKAADMFPMSIIHHPLFVCGAASVPTDRRWCSSVPNPWRERRLAWYEENLDGKNIHWNDAI